MFGGEAAKDKLLRNEEDCKIGGGEEMDNDEYQGSEDGVVKWRILERRKWRMLRQRLTRLGRGGVLPVMEIYITCQPADRPSCLRGLNQS